MSFRSVVVLIAAVLTGLGWDVHAFLSGGFQTAEATADKAPRAVENTKSEDLDEATRLKNRIIALQNQSRLSFRKVVLCSNVEGYGVYTPLDHETPASSFYLYFEPANVSQRFMDDRYEIRCSVDLMVFDRKGTLIAGKKDILTIHRVSRSPVLDLYYRVHIPLNKPLRGYVTVNTIFRDMIKDDSLSESYKLNIGVKDEQPIERL